MLNAVRHQTSAPPPKLKKLRKNELAANAMVRPNTIWISRRKPPLVSPKASVRPVMMMMITATILATGAWTDSRPRSEEHRVWKEWVNTGRYRWWPDHKKK